MGLLQGLLVLILSTLFYSKSSCFKSSVIETQLNPIIIEAKYGLTYSYELNETISYIFQYSADCPESFSLWPARISVKSDLAESSSPLLVVVRTQKSVYSWTIPYVVQTENSIVPYEMTSRTICPDVLNANSNQDMIVTVSSASPDPLTFSLVTTISPDFVVKLSDQRHLVTSPSTPVFYNFQFDNRTESVLLVVQSPDDLCMSLSVQNITCPVVDLERNVKYEGQWQTVSTKGGMLVNKRDFPLGFFIVFVVHSEDSDCNRQPGSGIQFKRDKHISFSIERNISYENYLIATLVLLSIFAFIYMVALSIGMSCTGCQPNIAVPGHLLSPDVPSVSTISAINEISVQSMLARAPSCDSSLDEADIDFLPDRDFDKNVFRTKTLLFVTDLSRKGHQVLSGKSKLYFWNLITIGIFYSLPVAQLVLTYQKVLNDSGNQDMCYYNYLCSHPLWILSDFNHVFSNIGYVFFGFLFILITRYRENASPADNRCYGIPDHFGFYYAMGMALIMEGVLSACYHVCPSHSNFQFDTSFMYIISMLSILKIYQCRHPDINASAYSTFVALAFVIFIAMVGVLEETQLFYIVFTVIHVLLCLFLSAKIYYMGRWKLDGRKFRRMCGLMLADLKSPRHFFRPMYLSRLVLLLCGNVFNWLLAAAQLKYRFVNFGTYFLAVFMVNLCLYLMFYIAMKILSGERIMPYTCVYLLAAFAFWGMAMFFFIHKSISWTGTPAQSRMFNQRCVLLNFYDDHDVWHVISATAMFFSFMSLLALDDDVRDKHRDTLPVF